MDEHFYVSCSASFVILGEFRRTTPSSEPHGAQLGWRSSMRLLYQSVISGYIPISSFLLSGHWQSQGQQQGGAELNTMLEQQGGLCSLLKEIGKSGGGAQVGLHLAPPVVVGALSQRQKMLLP
jgi:hypothetical protein